MLLLMIQVKIQREANEDTTIYKGSSVEKQIRVAAGQERRRFALFLKDGEQGRDWGKRPVKVRSVAVAAALMVVRVVIVHIAVGGQRKRQVCRAIQDIGNTMAALNVGRVVVVDLAGTVLTTVVLVQVVVGLHERGQALGSSHRGRLALVLVRIRRNSISGRAHAAVPGRGRGRVWWRLEHGRVGLVVSCSPGLVGTSWRMDGRHPGPRWEIHHRVLRL